MKDDDDWDPPGKPVVLADIDFAEVCASSEEDDCEEGMGDGVERPSWYQHEYGAELMHSQVGIFVFPTPISLHKLRQQRNLIPAGTSTSMAQSACTPRWVFFTHASRKIATGTYRKVH